MGVVSRAIGDQKYVLSGFFVPFDADDVCTDRIEAESCQKQLLHKLAIHIAPLGSNGGSSQQQINLTITFGRHLLYVRARSCRIICKAVVEIGWSCCYVRWYRRSGYDCA